MSALEKLLRKVEQDRIRGHDERALTRLKEAFAEQPQEFLLAREAASLCFQLRRAAEGVGVLRTALRRTPHERSEILAIAEEEFQRRRSLELAEFLFDIYLSANDLDKARETVRALEAGDQERLLVKLRARARSLREDVPEGEHRHDLRTSAILVAEILVLAALGRWNEMSDTCERVLDLDAKWTEALGHLCKLELQTSRDCLDLRLVLGRCYLQVGDFERAAEQFAAIAADARCRARAVHWLGRAPASPLLLPVRARLLLLEKQFEVAAELLEELCKGGDSALSAARAVLEAVPEAAHATDRLRQMYARALAGTSAVDRAVRELEGTRGSGADVNANLRVADQILEQRPRDPEALLLRARLSLDLGDPEAAAPYFRRAFDADPDRQATLRTEIEAAHQKAPQSAAMGRLLVTVLLDMGQPQQAADALQQWRDSRSAPAPVLYETALAVASRYGLSAELLTVFVEAAIEVGEEEEGRAAVVHYHSAPGTRVHDFVRRIEVLLHQRPELAAGLSRVLAEVQLPPALRLDLLRPSLMTDEAEAALRELGVLVAEEPELRDPALAALETLLHSRGDLPRALELAAELHLDAGHLVPSAQLLARALRAEPAAADRICRRADRLFRRAPADDEVWRPLVLGLLEAGRHRHARDLCERAAQTLPAARQGFLHFTRGCIHLESGQASAAANAFESALHCQDTVLERVIAGLRRAVETDAQLGHARYVLARALLLARADRSEAVSLLSEAVRFDPMLADLVLETLHEHGRSLENHGPALALAGALQLRRGERPRGVSLLDQALRIAPELGPQILVNLQVEWDRDPENAETGMALARALLVCKQEKRACRLLAELVRRFPAWREKLAAEVKHLAERSPLPEAQRVLWDLLLAQGEREAALRRVQDAVHADGVTSEHRIELLESALQRFPGEAWIPCELASLEIRSGNETRGEERLRELMVRNAEAHSLVLAALRETGTSSENLALLEVDTFLAASRGQEAHAALQRFRTAFPAAAAEAVPSRLRLLVEGGETQGGAEVDLAQLLREQGEMEAATSILKEALARYFPAAAKAASGAAALGVGEAAAAPPTAREREIRRLLATLYVDLGRVAEGREILASVLQHEGGDTQAYGFLEQLSARGLSAKMEQLRETSARAPSNLRARLELARLSLLARDFAAAREALGFSGDGSALETARRYLLARSYADADQPHLAAAVSRSIDVDGVPDAELRRNVLYLRARCTEQLGRYGEAHVLYLRLIAEFPGFKPAQERARATYKLHLESSLEPPALVLEKRTHLDPAASPRRTHPAKRDTSHTEES